MSFLNTWWIPLEKAGFDVERKQAQGIVKSQKARVFVHKIPDGHLMIVFSAPLVYWGKNLQLAKKVHDIFIQHCGEHPNAKQGV